MANEVIEKYPVKNTTCPTPIDDAIAEETAWLKEHNPSLWEETQKAPSEISFKIYMLGFVNADYGLTIQNLVEGKSDKQPPTAEAAEILRNHPDLTLRDLEWEFEWYKAANSPAVVPALRRLKEFKEKHGITD